MIFLVACTPPLCMKLIYIKNWGIEAVCMCRHILCCFFFNECVQCFNLITPRRRSLPPHIYQVIIGPKVAISRASEKWNYPFWDPVFRFERRSLDEKFHWFMYFGCLFWLSDIFPVVCCLLFYHLFKFFCWQSWCYLGLYLCCWGSGQVGFLKYVWIRLFSAVDSIFVLKRITMKNSCSQSPSHL